MGSMTISKAFLEDLADQARKLTSDVLCLVNLFDEEAIQLSRHDAVSRIRALHSSVSQQLDSKKESERAAHYGGTKARMVTSWGELAAGSLILLATKDKGWRVFSDHLLRNVGGKRRPYGTVMVCVGPKGLPDDVQVVRISELARESNREESEVIGKLRKSGLRLFSEEDFSRLIARLVAEIQEGRLALPVPPEKLPDVQPSVWVKVEPAQTRWASVARQHQA